MVWHNGTQSYRGSTADGKIVEVTGDEYAEALTDGILALAGESDIDNVHCDDIEKFSLEVFKEIDDPNTWAALVGNNQNVEFV